MERAFATDFSGVRVHQGGEARAAGARALASGSRLFFAPGHFAPHSRGGRELIGHELAHVVQQRAGRTAPSSEPATADAALEAEARFAGARAARGEPAGLPGTGAQPGGDAGAAVQGDYYFRTASGTLVPRKGDPDGERMQKEDAGHEEKEVWGAGTHSDTEGSDTEDEREYDPTASDQERNQSIEKRLKRNVLRSRLATMRSDDEEKRLGAMFPKGEAPDRPLYRKESKFKHPADKAFDRTVVSPSPSHQEMADLAELNRRLGEGMPIHQAADKLPGSSSFMVAQYRGLHYSKPKFEPEQRRAHRGLDELGRPIYSQSALALGEGGAAKYYGLYNDPQQKDALSAHQDTLTAHATKIRAALQALRMEAATKDVQSSVTRSTARFAPQSLADVSTHLYSEDYEGYHKALGEAQARAKSGEAPEPLDAIFAGLPNASNPIVSTGDVPYHAQRYAYGLKPYQGHEAEVLEPGYDQQGRPRRPYSGKTYTSLHPLTDYDPLTGPRQLVPLQNEHRINISKMIIPERESQFEGMMEEDRVVAQHKAKFPSFAKDYKPVYAQKYGLDEATFGEFQKTFTHGTLGDRERVFTESLLSTHLAKHGEIRAVEEARRLALKNGARLVYRTGPAGFGFAPPAIVNDPRAEDGSASSSRKPASRKKPAATRPASASDGYDTDVEMRAPAARSPASARFAPEDAAQQDEPGARMTGTGSDTPRARVEAQIRGDDAGAEIPAFAAQRRVPKRSAREGAAEQGPPKARMAGPGPAARRIRVEAQRDGKRKQQVALGDLSVGASAGNGNGAASSGDKKRKQ
jgi:hypothetical protein